MHQLPTEQSQVSVDMINQAQVISDYILEGLELEYDVEEQWYHIDELDQFMRYRLHLKPKCTSELHLSRD